MKFASIAIGTPHEGSRWLSRSVEVLDARFTPRAYRRRAVILFRGPFTGKAGWLTAGVVRAERITIVLASSAKADELQFAQAGLREAGCFAIYDGPADLLARYDQSVLAQAAARDSKRGMD